MRAQTIDLDIAGTRLSVICQDPTGLRRLRSALSDHVIDERAPAGFLVQVPAGRNKLHVLLDRSGFVLGRSRHAEDCVAMLGSHLAALLPPPAATVRTRMRAFVGEDGALALAGFPLFTEPPITERRLERSSQRVVDRLGIDIRADGMVELTPMPWPDLAATRPIGGHAPANVEPAPIGSVLIPGVGQQRPSRASVVSYLASAVPPMLSIVERVELAERLAKHPVVSVDADDRSARYRALDNRG